MESLCVVSLCVCTCEWDGVSLQSETVNYVSRCVMCDQLAALEAGPSQVGTLEGNRHSLLLRPQTFRSIINPADPSEGEWK